MSKKNLHLFTLLFFFISAFMLLSSPTLFSSLWFEFSLSMKSGVDWSGKVIFDDLSICFMVMVSLVSSNVLIYSIYYMDSEKNFNKFMLIVFLFILSMFLMSTSSSLFWVMIGWDGLGVSSFCLIIFFQNWKSMTSGMTTFLTNRLGDFFLISSIIWVSNASESLLFPAFLMIIITAMTKSAQLPFSAWLPMAMAAPTPVSALVHSSTLVTAGIFLLMRFKFWSSSEELSYLVMAIASMTAIFAGWSAWGELDMKKVVALSTLSHLGLIIFFISLNDIIPAMIHLLSHAFFKSLLFMIVGVFIHELGNKQDFRKMVSSMMMSKFTWIMFLISLMSMVGIPFLSGFVSKELMVLSIFSFSSKSISFWLLMIMISLTCCYSYRMVYEVIFNKMVDPSISTPGKNNKFLSLPCIMGGVLSILGGVLVVGELSSKVTPSFSSFFQKPSMVVLLIFMSIGFMMGHYSKFLSSTTTYWSFLVKSWFIGKVMPIFFTYSIKHFWTMFFSLDISGFLDHSSAIPLNKMKGVTKMTSFLSSNSKLILMFSCLSLLLGVMWISFVSSYVV